jgi:ubiquinol-cytochrome c reductase cytochrome c1 subunit
MRTETRAVRALLLGSLLAGVLASAVAAGEEGEGAGLQSANVNIANHESLQRGARNFINYCSGCHSAQYVRYNRVAADLGISDAQMRDNLIFDPAVKVAETIKSAMPAADAAGWFGAAPPDLSLMARARGPDYIYTFLKSFYLDASRPTGVNNLVLKGTAMPHVLASLQGVQKAVYGKVVEPGSDGKSHEVEVFDKFELLSPGTMTPAQYDRFVKDTVAFLVYIGEPSAERRENLGIFVVLYLLLFTALARAMYKHYWKDVH